MPVLRTGLFLLPHNRSTGAGIALVLEQAPHLGWRGAVADLLRALMGTRMLGIAAVSAVLGGPPATALALHLLLYALTANSTAYCAAPLLAAPLTRSRLRALAAAIEYGRLPVAAAALSLPHPTSVNAAILEGACGWGKGGAQQ